MPPLHASNKLSPIKSILQWQKAYGSAYDLLSVSESATEEEIHKAYRRLVKQIHPDKHKNSPESTEAFKILGEAKAYLLYKKLSFVDQLNASQTIHSNAFYKADTHTDSFFFHPDHTFSPVFNWTDRTPFYSYSFDPSSHDDDTQNPYVTNSLFDLYFASNLNQLSKVLMARLNDSLSHRHRSRAKFGIDKKVQEKAINLSHNAFIVAKTNMLPWLFLCQNKENLPFFMKLYMLLDQALWPNLETQSEELLLHENRYFLRAGLNNQVWLMKFLFIHHANDEGKQAIGINIIKSGQFDLFRILYDEGWFDKCKKEIFIIAFKQKGFKNISEFSTISIFLNQYPALCQMAEANLFKPKNYCYTDKVYNRYFGSSFVSSNILNWLSEQNFIEPEAVFYTALVTHNYTLVEKLLKSESHLSINLLATLAIFVVGDAYNDDNLLMGDSIEKAILPEPYENNEEGILACQSMLLDEIITRFRPPEQDQLESILSLVLIDYLGSGWAPGRYGQYLINKCFGSDARSLYQLNVPALYKVINNHITNETVLTTIWKNALYKWSGHTKMTNVLSQEGKDYLYGNNLGILGFDHVLKIPDQPGYRTDNFRYCQNLCQLIQAEPRLLETQYSALRLMSEFMPNYYWVWVYGRNINALLLACYYNRQEVAQTMVDSLDKDTQSDLINHMSEIVAIQDIPDPWWSYVFYFHGMMINHKVMRYNAFHEAIMQGFDDVALAMIEKGADVSLKATLWHRVECLFLFQYLQKTEESPLQLALKAHIPKTASRLLIEELKLYISLRAQQGEFITRIGYGNHTFWRGGYSKEDKMNAANLLLEKLNEPMSASVDDLQKLKQDYPALTQGRLGRLFNHAVYIQSGWLNKNGCAMSEEKTRQEADHFQRSYGIIERKRALRV